MNSIFLNKAKKGQTGVISHLPTGHAANQRLKEMGLREGMRISVQQIMPFSGPAVIKVGQTQIAIGHGMSSRIKIDLD